MNLPIFADTAMVEIQGEQALQFIGADYEYAQYQIGGLQELQVFLTDHREAGVLAFQEWAGSGETRLFLERINAPAFILVTQAGERAWMIDLYETRDISPINTLSIGVDTPMPLRIHSYDFYHDEPAGQGSYNVLAIYQNDPEPIPAYSLVHAYVER